MEKVLVVDDNEQNCELIRDIVSTWGYDVYKVFQGRDAIQLAEKILPDIVLLDVMLPGMNGFEVCHAIKNSPRTENIPVVMMTVLTDVEDRIHGLKVGADNFLVKPVNYHELKYIISSLVARKKLNDKTEQHLNIIESYLVMQKMYSLGLYKHIQSVHDYCQRVAKWMNLSDAQKERLLIAAYVHDVGYLVTNNFELHAEYGAKLIEPLKISSWLMPLIEFHHENLSSPKYNPLTFEKLGIKKELDILITINCFVNALKDYDKETALEILIRDCRQGLYSRECTQALEQVLKDEKFLEKLQPQV